MDKPVLRVRGGSALAGLPPHSATRCSRLLSPAVAAVPVKAKRSSPPVSGPSPLLRKSPRKNAGSKPAAEYVPATVYKPQPAHVVQQRGRKKEIAPAWTQRKTRHFPDEALANALNQLKPAADKSKLRCNSPFAKPDCVAVCEAINKYYSVPEKGWVCNLKWFTLREHAEAVANGEEIAKPGEHTTIIPGTMVDMWAAWIGLDATDQRNPSLKQALQMLWELCEVAEIDVPALWLSKGPPTCWWETVAKPVEENGYGYPDLKARVSKNLDVARRHGENPVRIHRYYERMKTDITEAHSSTDRSSHSLVEH